MCKHKVKAKSGIVNLDTSTYWTAALYSGWNLKPWRISGSGKLSRNMIWLIAPKVGGDKIIGALIKNEPIPPVDYFEPTF